MDIQLAIRSLLARCDLSQDDMRTVMRSIMSGLATPAQIGGFLIALRLKGETASEIAGAASVLRECSVRVVVDDEHLVDTCGTGGDGASTFNISTAAALVAAAAGARVAKHGNRSISGRCGSADLLEAAGVRLELSSHQVAQCLDIIGFGFMFAPRHHEAMRHANAARKELGVRTLFNLLGPLTNPAGAKHQLIGVYDAAWLTPMAEALRYLGCERALVVHGEDGLDEISLSSPTRVVELKENTISSWSVCPEDFGYARSSSDAFMVSSVEDSLSIVRDVLGNTPGPARDIVCLNAGATLYVAGVCPSLKEGISRAGAAIAGGTAAAKLDALIRLTQELPPL